MKTSQRATLIHPNSVDPTNSDSKSNSEPGQTNAAAARWPAEQLIESTAEHISGYFPKRAFLFRHRLAGHPLFQLPRLMELARGLAETDVEYNAGNVPIGLDPKLTPRTGLSVEETIRRIADCGSWMALRFINQDPAYRDLLHQVIDETLAGLPVPLRGVCQQAAFLFISSPGAVTPFHVDPEHNFLVQIQGIKTVSVFDAEDRSVISDEEIEAFLCGGHRNLRYRDEFQTRASTFNLRPGDALYIPITAPHWVKNGDAVSISFSATFRSGWSEHREVVYHVNKRMRKLGVQPAPYGEHDVRDQMKFLAFRSASTLKKALLRKSRGPESNGMRSMG